MSRSHRKQRKKGPSAPAIPPASALRPRLDALWSNATLPQHDRDALSADLDAITQGITPALFLPIMLRAYSAAPPETQARLDEVLPAWLHDRGYDAELEALMTHRSLDSAHEELAVQWLAAAGRDPSTLVALTQWDPFYRADFCGDDSQAALILLWYVNRQQTRVQGYNVLIDYNPPWDGAVKDIVVYPQRAPLTAVAEFVDRWRARMPLATIQIDAVEAKEKILQALACNRAANIRLPEDLIASRELFVRYVLALPADPLTPSFTVEDFDFLAQHGERPEAIMQFERSVGRRVRRPDGTEVFIMGGDLDVAE